MYPRQLHFRAGCLHHDAFDEHMAALSVSSLTEQAAVDGTTNMCADEVESPGPYGFAEGIA